MKTELNVESNDVVDVFYNGDSICKAYNIRELIREESGETYYQYDVVKAPKGVSEEALDKQIKFNSLDSLCIEYDGDIYQADPVSRSNMLVKLLENPQGGFNWKLKDNTFKEITTEDLKTILYMALKEVEVIIGGANENK